MPLSAAARSEARAIFAVGFATFSGKFRVGAGRVAHSRPNDGRWQGGRTVEVTERRDLGNGGAVPIERELERRGII